METNIKLEPVILFLEVKDWETELLRKALGQYKLIFLAEKIQNIDLAKYKDVNIISSFVDSQLNSTYLSKLPNLRLICTRSTGYDHIDLNYCKQNHVSVCNVPYYGENTVAEHALALILALLRRIPESIERVKFSGFDPSGLTGHDIKDKVVGVVGTGHIGQNLIKYVLAMGAKVLAYDKFPNETLARSLGFEYVDLDYLMSKADIISYHVPYNKETKHLFNKQSLNLVKQGVIVINTSRGGIIETDALFDGIKSGVIGGAGLDVIEEESFIKEEIEILYSDRYSEVDYKTVLENKLLLNFKNVIVTPHNAFNSVEALNRIVETTIKNVELYISQKPQNLVSL